MASSSNHLVKYDVFLSFRGADTRNNFTSHLYSSLTHHGIMTFIDNRLERGEEIEPAILKAIQESIISVVILSKNYASSSWCLDELVKIFECRDKQGQKIIPVFYHVDPTEVDNQTGSIGEAFAKHEQDSTNINMDKVPHWRTVLSRVANISGEVMSHSRVESELIGVIVNKILKNLRYDLSYGFKNLVGIYSRVFQVESLLCIGTNNVRTIGIWGMGGIGKTTIAKVVYQTFASQFEGSCFLESVRDHNPLQLRNELLLQLLSEGNTNSRQMFGMRQLRHKKLLIVLDNVDNYNQIEVLSKEHNWLGEGSRIIITSRDKSVFQDRVDGIYEVKPLTDYEALHLFSLCAFKENQPKRDHIGLSNEVVSYARGNPLALQVLGLFLYGKNKEEWRSALKKLERFPDKKIQNILKISYDGLDSHDQQIFLHIAFMFKGEPISRVVDLLDACGSSTLIGLRELADKSLIIMTNEKVDIHDLLQEMGRQIICQECKDPAKRSRLWNHEDICNVLTKNSGSEAIEGLWLDMSKLKKPLRLHSKVFAKMNGIKLFKFHIFDNNVGRALEYKYFECVPNNLHIPKGLKCLPNELRLLEWQFYPEKSLPSNFNSEKLVEINLSGSCVEKLWKGEQDLPNLKKIKLSHCRRLIKMPNFSAAPNLEIIDCEGCTSLLEVCPSISYLSNLNELYLSSCYNIKSVPTTKCLRVLWLCGCSIKQFPQVPTTIEILHLDGTEIEEIPCSIISLSRLLEMGLFGCLKLKNISNSIFQLRHLEYLSCGPYLNPQPFQDNIRLLPSLRRLYLIENDLERIPSSIQQMSCLEDLHLISCKRLPSLPQLPLQLQRLNFSNCKSLKLVSNSLTGLQEYWGQLIFANCTSLNQKEKRGILMHAMQRILVLARTPPPYLHKEFDRSIYDIREQLMVVVPGNNIPKY